MKRFFAVILILSVITVSAGSALAAPVPAGILKSAIYSSGNGSEAVDITVANFSDYSIMTLSNPERIVVDLYNTTWPNKLQSVQVNGTVIKSVRIAQFEPGIARVVLDLAGQAEYGAERTEAGLRVYIGDRPDTPVDSEAEVTVPGNGESPGSSQNPPVVPAVPQKLSINKSNFNVEYTPKTDSEEVAILLKNYKNYTVTRLTGPDRLVIDIPNTKYTGKTQEVPINGNQIKSLRYSQYSSKISRIVLDMNDQSKYTVKESSGKLLLTLEKPDYKNMTYSNNGDRVYITLKGAKLTSGEENLKKLYTEKSESSGKKYSVTFPSAQADLGEGTLKINDDYLKSIEIKKDQSNGTTTITFTANRKYSYLVYTRPNLEDTAITILKPATNAEKLVVIDAGHGGTAPGAIYKGLYEKDLNLDTALRLDKLLESKKINTYMIREEDIDVNNYERAYIANTLNATLFLSIHYNAMDDSSYGGTMTLHYPQKSNATSFTGKKFADIIQGKLIGSLGTINRKTIERPNLIVLKATTMPASLAEIAFMTNSGDRSKLQTEAFRQKAAQALSDSVIEALKAVR